MVEGQVRPGGRVCENGEHDPYPQNGNWDACSRCDMKWPAEPKRKPVDGMDLDCGVPMDEMRNEDD